MTPEFIEILNRVNPKIVKRLNVNLVEAEIIDSLDIMNLVAELEEAYGIEFDPFDIDADTFASAETIWELLNRYLVEELNDSD